MWKVGFDETPVHADGSDSYLPPQLEVHPPEWEQHMQHNHKCEPQHYSLMEPQQQLHQPPMFIQNPASFRSPLSLSNLIATAQHKWLDPASILLLLSAGQRRALPVCSELQKRPGTGALILYDRSHVSQFRVDGHEWVKKKTSMAVREDHVKHKVDGEVRLYAGHVHSMENKSFDRRAYWDLKGGNSMVLVHFLDKNKRAQGGPHALICRCLKCDLEKRSNRIEDKDQTARPFVENIALNGNSSRYQMSSTSSSSASSCDGSTGFSADGVAKQMVSDLKDEKLDFHYHHHQQQQQQKELNPHTHHQDLFSSGDVEIDHEFSDFLCGVTFDNDDNYHSSIAHTVLSPDLTQNPEQVDNHTTMMAKTSPQQDAAVQHTADPSLTPQDIVFEDVCPQRIEGGTRLIITLLRKSGLPMPTASDPARASIKSVAVRFGDKGMIPVSANMNRSGSIVVYAPRRPFGTVASLTLLINGEACAVVPDLVPCVRYAIPPANRNVRGGKSMFNIGAPATGAVPEATASASAKAAVEPASQQRRQPVVPPPVITSIVSGMVPKKTVSPVPGSAQRLLKRKWGRIGASPSDNNSASSTPMNGNVMDTDSINEEDSTADVDTLNEDELSDLSESLLERVVRVLVQMASDETELVGELDALDESGFNLLHYMVLFQHHKLVELLLDHGADPNRATSTGDSPLHLAAETGDVSIAQRLVAAGGNALMLDADQQSCAQLARKYGFEELAAWFTNPITSAIASDQHSLQPHNHLTHNLHPSGAAQSSITDRNALDSAFSVWSTPSPSSPQLSLGTPSREAAVPKESREDKQNKMLRHALASLSLKDKCALSLSDQHQAGSGLGHAGSDSEFDSGDDDDEEHSCCTSARRTGGMGGVSFSSMTSWSGESFGSSASSDGSSFKEKKEGSGKEKRQRPLHKVVSELTLKPVISAMHEEERSELEAEARIIQNNFRRWMLKRNVQTAQRVQKETKGYLAGKKKSNKMARTSSIDINDDDSSNITSGGASGGDAGALGSSGGSGGGGQIQKQAIKVQAVSKGFLARKEYKQTRQDVIQVQAATRGLLARKTFNSWRKQLSAAIVIQRSIRRRQRRRQGTTPTQSATP